MAWTEAEGERQVDTQSYKVSTEDVRVFRRNRGQLQLTKEGMKPDADGPPPPPTKQQPLDPVKTSEPWTTTQVELPVEVPKNFPSKDNTGTCPVTYM